MAAAPRQKRKASSPTASRNKLSKGEASLLELKNFTEEYLDIVSKLGSNYAYKTMQTIVTDLEKAELNLYKAELNPYTEKQQTFLINQNNILNELTTQLNVKQIEDKSPKLIEYRSNPEYPENIELGIMDYQTIPLYIKSVPYVPRSFKIFLSEQHRSKTRKGVTTKPRADAFAEMFEVMNRSVKLLDDELSNNNKEFLTVAELATKPITLVHDSLVLFSGIADVIVSSSDIKKWITSGRGSVDMLFRSTTVDLRIAIHFAPQRKLENHTNLTLFHQLVGKNEDMGDEYKDKNINDGTNIQIIFVLTLSGGDKIPYVSPSNSWEAEVLFRPATYTYDGYFTTTKDNTTFLFIKVIKSADRPDLIKHADFNKIRRNRAMRYMLGREDTEGSASSSSEGSSEGGFKKNTIKKNKRRTRKHIRNKKHSRTRKHRLTKKRFYKK